MATGGAFTGVSKVNALRDRAAQTVETQKELAYYTEAEKINDYYYSRGVETRINVIRQTLRAVDKYLPKYFPEGPFNRRDFIAMAMVESNFNQYLVGTRKEFGIFQLMPESCKWAGVSKNQFDIEVNTEMAMFVLQAKHKERKEYKMTIIGYNGVVKTSKGTVSTVYWDKFKKARNAVDDILGDSHISSK